MIAYQGRIWFLADDGLLGAELWYSDGTPTGTRMVKNANPARFTGGAPVGIGVDRQAAVGERDRLVPRAARALRHRRDVRQRILLREHIDEFDRVHDPVAARQKAAAE